MWTLLTVACLVSEGELAWFSMWTLLTVACLVSGGELAWCSMWSLLTVACFVSEGELAWFSMWTHLTVACPVSEGELAWFSMWTLLTVACLVSEGELAWFSMWTLMTVACLVAGGEFASVVIVLSCGNISCCFFFRWYALLLVMNYSSHISSPLISEECKRLMFHDIFSSNLFSTFSFSWWVAYALVSIHFTNVFLLIFSFLESMWSLLHVLWVLFGIFH